MVRFRPPSVGVASGSSSSPVGESVAYPALCSISLAILPRLPLLRAAPASTYYRRWLSCVPFAERPFNTSMLSLGDALFSSSIAFSSKKRADTLLHHLSCKTHSFLTTWGEFSPTLEDVTIILKLTLFGDFDLSATVLDHHIAKMAKSLKVATVESARHSREKLALRRFQQGTDIGASSIVKMRLPKGKDSKDTSPPKRKKVPKESVKYTYASWIRYFLVIFLLVNILRLAQIIPNPWNARPLFLFGVRLPLASFYLGSLHGRLDQLQEQMYSSYGRFSVNSCIGVAFIQVFLYERFPNYGPVRRISRPPPRDNSPPEYRVQGWSLGRPRQYLVSLTDDEGSFVFHPYTSSFFSGVEGMDRIYLEPAFSSWNNKGLKIEGVIGGALFPFSYRPDRVCRQFGLDQPPLPLELDPLPLHEAMKVVLFVERQCLPLFNSSLFIPSDRVGSVLDEWVTYQHRLKASIVYYEGVTSVSLFWVRKGNTLEENKVRNAHSETGVRFQWWRGDVISGGVIATKGEGRAPHHNTGEYIDLDDGRASCYACTTERLEDRDEGGCKPNMPNTLAIMLLSGENSIGTRTK
ncbi:Aminotransferase-like, plant mobile domain [Sesbania bispinosa]|nr:Aminotransferase-like, plant mobile domain [Sesbania bispinosa]